MKKAVVFDFNGTMFFDEDKHVLSWRAFAKEMFNREISDEEFPAHIHGFSNDEILPYLAERKFTLQEVEEYATKKELVYQRICEEDKENLHLVFGLEKFLDTLKANNIKIAICTASMKPNVDWYYRTFPLPKWFSFDDIIYDDGTLKRGKPDPEIYLRALSHLHVKGEDSIVFEDSISGLQSAYAAKVDTLIAIEPEGTRKEVTSMPGVKAVLPDFTKIPSFVYQELGIEEKE